MKVPDQLARHAIEVATKVARKCRLDPDVAQSIAGELVVEIVATVETEEEGFRRFSTEVHFTLVTRILDELRVFGPSTMARYRRRKRQQTLPDWQREGYVLVQPVYKSTLNMVDFLDQFRHDPKLQEYVLLVVAGYTQKELMQDFGYTRKQIQELKQKVENVYQNS